MTDYRIEFPDFAEADMPSIPEGWEDTSWHNDACPSFMVGDLHIFIDFADPAQREVAELERFSIHINPDQPEVALATNDWAEVLAYVEKAR